MSNPLFNQFGNNNQMFQFMNEVKKLQETIKNPKQIVENLLQNGQMTQQQFNEFSKMANQIIGNKKV